MIIDRYLFREIFASLFAVIVVLLLIFVSKHFVRYLSDAAAGELPVAFVFQLLGLFTLSYLVLIIPASMYIAVLISLGRMYKDSEITVMAACGIGLPRILRGVFMASLVLALLMTAMAFWVAPWAERMHYQLRGEAKVESEIKLIAPGRFHEIRGGQGVFYIEGMSDDKSSMRNVFVHLEDQGKVDVFSANSGGLWLDEKSAGEYLILNDGVRYEALPDASGYRLHDYEKSGVRIAQNEYVRTHLKSLEKTMTMLWNSDTPADKAELHWRISMPISCVLLILLAVFLSHTNPRQGRFAKLGLAIVFYILYVYMMILSRSWIKNEVIPASLGMWWIHLIVAVLILFYAYKQLGWRRYLVKWQVVAV